MINPASVLLAYSQVSPIRSTIGSLVFTIGIILQLVRFWVIITLSCLPILVMFTMCNDYMYL